MDELFRMTGGVEHASTDLLANAIGTAHALGHVCTAKGCSNQAEQGRIRSR